jgi:hypothetical protein
MESAASMRERCHSGNLGYDAQTDGTQVPERH